MLWGTFTTAHFVTLGLAIVLNIGLYGLGRVLKEPYRKWVFFFFSLFGWGAIIYNLVMWNSPLEYLPLQLCSFNAMVLPVVVLTKNKTLGNCLILWALGALMALVANNGVANFKIASWTFFWYYFPHVIEFGLPFILLAFGYIDLKPKFIISTVVITLVLYTIAHLTNLGLNKYFIDNNITDWQGLVKKVNYMFSICGENETNPFILMFHNIIPYDYWYMYLIVPIVAVYLTPFYLTRYLLDKKKQKKLETVKEAK